MQFQNIIGQDAVKEKLVGLSQNNRLSHALLFLGKEGNGTLSLARAFAQFLLCERVQGKSDALASPGLFGDPEPLVDANINQNDSCGICASCTKAAQLAHPDIHFTFPTVTVTKDRPTISADLMKEWRSFILKYPYGNVFDWLQTLEAENKQGNINVAECNDIMRKLSLKSFESGYKIQIIWMAEFLGKEGNKLLKLIEEPPPQTLFFLVAEQADNILPTILSRTQLIKVPYLNESDVKDALITRENIEPGQAALIAWLSKGNYRDALQQIQHSADDWETVLRDWMNSILRTGPMAQFKWVEEMAKQGREKQKQFLLYFIQMLETAIRIRFGNDPTNSAIQLDDKEQGRLDFAQKLNKIGHPEQLESMASLLNDSIYQIERNANAKLLFHALSIRLYHLIGNKTLILI